MSSREREDPGYFYSVDVRVPLLPPDARGSLVSALHHADRRLGVGVNVERDPTRLMLLADAVAEDAARSKARSLIVEAAAAIGLPPDCVSGMEIEQVTRRRSRPGRPRFLTFPASLEYRTVTLPRGDRLRAAHEGPTGDWFVHIKDAENQAWAGRDLLAVLSELLELPHGKREDWVYEAIRQLAGRETPLGTRYACPCCDFLTLTRPPSGTYAGCPVCVWEDDGAQFEDLDYAGGANKVSLRQAREDFRREGVSELRLRHLARRPHLEEHP